MSHIETRTNHSDILMDHDEVQPTQQGASRSEECKIGVADIFNGNYRKNPTALPTQTLLPEEEWSAAQPKKAGALMDVSTGLLGDLEVMKGDGVMALPDYVNMYNTIVGYQTTNPERYEQPQVVLPQLAALFTPEQQEQFLHKPKNKQQE